VLGKCILILSPESSPNDVLKFVKIELGSGVGLPGIAVAYFAEKVMLTDYIPQVLAINVNPSLLSRSRVVSCLRI